MIKINSFSQVNNFTRSYWEFYEDYLVTRTKSLTLGIEEEIKYEKIKYIHSKRMADLGWLWASFVTIGLVGIVRLWLIYVHITSPLVDLVEKIVVQLGLLMILLAFRKYEFYCFYDANQIFLTTVRVNNKTSNLSWKP